MSLEYLGFKQEGRPWAEKAASIPPCGASSPWPLVHLSLWCPPPPSSALLPHTCPAVFPQVLPLSCSSVDSLHFCVSVPGQCLLLPIPPQPWLQDFLWRPSPPCPHPHLDLSLASPDRAKILSPGCSVAVWNSCPFLLVCEPAPAAGDPRKAGSSLMFFSLPGSFLGKAGDHTLPIYRWEGS